MFCSNCGTENSNESRFCSRCGAPLETNVYSVNTLHKNYVRKTNAQGPFGSVLLFTGVVLATVLLILSFTMVNPVKQVSALFNIIEMNLAGFGFISTTVSVLSVISVIASIAIVIALWLVVLSRFLGTFLMNMGARIANVVLVIYAVMMLAAIAVSVYIVVWAGNMMKMYGGVSGSEFGMTLVYVVVVIVIAVCILYFVFYMKAAKAADNVIKSNGKLICSLYVPVFSIVMAGISTIGTLIMATNITYSITMYAGSSYSYTNAAPPGIILTCILSIASQIIFAIWILKNRVER